MLRRALATAAVSAIAVVGLAPAASAQIVDLTPVINGIPCDQMETGLKALNLIDEDTTRNELAAELRKQTGLILGIPLLTNIYSGQIADRALECEIVKEDPKTPFAGSIQFLEMFEGLSSAVAKK